MRFSASRIGAWMDCPLRAHFRYDQKLPTQQNAKASFGTIIHHVLDRYHCGLPVEDAVSEFLRLWDEPSLLNVAPDYWPKYTTYSSLKRKGVDIIRTYHEKGKWGTKKILASEHPFLVPFGDHEITGFVDFVELNRSGKGHPTVRIVDLKTSARAPSRVSLRLNVQFTVYTYASLQPEFWMGNGVDFPAMKDGEQLWHDTQNMQRRAIWFHLMTNKEIDAGERDDGDFMRLYRVCKEINKANEQGIHVPKIGDSCIYCDYNGPCGIDIPDRDKLELEV